MQHYRM